MWSFMAQPGLATATVDFTSDLSPLGVGLVGMVVLAAGAIAFMAIRHSFSQRTKPTVETVPAPANQQEAA